MKKFVLLVTTIFLANAAVFAESNSENIKSWQADKFGLFIHWGPVSLKATEISWSRQTDPDKQRLQVWKNLYGSIPAEEYDNLYKNFNPVQFDPQQWVQIAKDAGMKYIVFTTKHHDGFCNFDSKYTDYKITSPQSPYGKDIVKQLADACHKAGLKLGFYYSQPDWHNPDYFNGDRHEKYVEYLHNQVRELCTNYGKLDIIWFDGLDVPEKEWKSDELLKMIRQLQPGIIINNRTGLPADFDTPEQVVGGFQNNRPWESCMTIGTSWSYKVDDNIKSKKECIQTLVKVVGGDGNLLFNVGPMPDGRIEPQQVERLREMGDWLKKYGKSIYDTKGGPFKPGEYGVSTHKGNIIYLHVTNWFGENLTLPAIGKKIKKVEVLTGGKAEISQTQDSIKIKLPLKYQQSVDTIIQLTLDGNAAEITPVNVPSQSVASHKPVEASNVYQNDIKYDAQKAIDDDMTTRWATDDATKQAWLEIDLQQPTEISSALIIQECGQRIKKYQLEKFTDDKWESFYYSDNVQMENAVKFEPVTVTRIRLNILEAVEGPTIAEFRIFVP
ncbi:MAG TPA: alpha-L-fucosidase [Sedimentisphaerales bacterium]|nr:alpha-L-fucosidase [Sedimentisphaerales bacterium]